MPRPILIDGPQDLQAHWFEQVHTVGITAGASAPEVLVQSVIHGLKQYGAQMPEELAGRVENVSFSLPKELR